MKFSELQKKIPDTKINEFFCAHGEIDVEIPKEVQDYFVQLFQRIGDEFNIQECKIILQKNGNLNSILIVRDKCGWG